MAFGADHRADSTRPSRRGYALAIAVSALGHAGLFALLLVVIPALFKGTPPPPAYTVKIVDSIPAGDLGTHLPRLSHNKQPPPQPEKAKEDQPPAPPSNLPTPEPDAIALNTLKPSATMTPTPTPRLTPPPEPTIQATPKPKKPHVKPTVARTPAPTPTPGRASHRPVKAPPPPKVMVAAAAPTPGLREKLDRVRAQLLKEHLKALAAARPDDDQGADESAPNSGDGPVAATSATAGKGYGVGPGNGSAGILQDAGFLLYYQEVQKKIRAAWSFTGDNQDLTATVTFGINPDGSLNSIRVTASSRDPSFDDSVVRAIRRAAPFPPTPGKYREQFAEGLPAVFKLGELQGGG